MVNGMTLKKADNQMIDELFELIASLKSKSECEELFEDLLFVAMKRPPHFLRNNMPSIIMLPHFEVFVIKKA